MAAKMIEITCPGCNAPVSIEQKVCEWCKRPLVISSFQTIQEISGNELNKYVSSYRKALSENPDNRELNQSIAACFMKLKMYDQAMPYFEKAIADNFDNADLYLYAAICKMSGKRPFLQQKKNIDEAITYLNAGLLIEEKGIIRYFLAYVKRDFYEMKKLRISPSSQEELQHAVADGISETDVNEVFTLLGVPRPVDM